MSNITNCILSFSIGEHCEVFEIQMVKYFESSDSPRERFLRVDNLNFPCYGVERYVYIGAFNHLELGKLCAFISSFEWDDISTVQLLVCVQEDDIFREVQFTKNGYVTHSADILFMKG